MPRNCTVCLHPQRHEIEAGLQAGLSYRDVARRHNISKDAVSRHRAHVSLHSATALTTLAQIVMLLHQAETAATLSSILVTLKAARHCAETLMKQLNHGIERRRETTSY